MLKTSLHHITLAKSHVIDALCMYVCMYVCRVNRGAGGKEKEEEKEKEKEKKKKKTAGWCVGWV